MVGLGKMSKKGRIGKRADYGILTVTSGGTWKGSRMGVGFNLSLFLFCQIYLMQPVLIKLFNERSEKAFLKIAKHYICKLLCYYKY